MLILQISSKSKTLKKKTCLVKSRPLSIRTITTRDPQSWLHPQSSHWHLLDITRRHDISNILITRTMRGIDCWTDHIMLHCKNSFRIAGKQWKQSSRVKKKLNANKLNSPQFQHDLSDTHTKNLQQLTQDISNPDNAWAAFRDAVYSTAKAILWHPQRKQRDWFDENNHEIVDLLARKRAAHAAWLSDRNSVSKHKQQKKVRSETQAKIRQLKKAWWKAKAELQPFANQHATGA